MLLDGCMVWYVQVKTSKPHLKKLQQCVKSLSSEPEDPLMGPGCPLTAESFHWLSRKQIYVTVYLVSQLVEGCAKVRVMMRDEGEVKVMLGQGEVSIMLR